MSISSDNAVAASFATLATILISKKYTLDMSVYGALLAVNTMIAQYVMGCDIKEMEWFNSYNITILITVLTAWYLYKKDIIKQEHIYKIIGKNKEIKYRTLTINTVHDIEKYIKYTNFFSEYFDKPDTVNIGVISYNVTGDIKTASSEDDSRRVADAIEVKFKDVKHNVNGYYVWKRLASDIGFNKDIGTNIIKVDHFIEIHLESKTCTDVLNYFKDIEKAVKEKEKDAQNIARYYIKYTSIKYKANTTDLKNLVSNEHYQIYFGDKIPYEDSEKKYLDTFFSPSKKIIYPIVKQIHINPMKFLEMGQAPQCGYLLYGPPGTGKSSFIYRIAMILQRHVVSIDIRGMKKRDAIFSAIRKPTLEETSYSINLAPDNVIYMFDEFDRTVTELYNNDKKRAKELEEYKIVKKSSDKEDTPQEPKDTSDEMTCTDLLEFFQGPIPLSGAIFIATSNKFEEIKKMCPALVRPGRLTPVELGNPDSSTIKEISKYHFGKEIELSPDYSPTISSAQVMQYVIDAKMDSDKGYDFFAKCMTDSVSENNKRLSLN